MEKEITAKKPHSDELENLPLPEATTSVEEVVHFASVGIQADPVSFVSASTQTDESTSTEYLSHMQSTPAKQFLASQSPTSQFSDSTLCNESMETILSSSYIPSTCTSESEDIASEEDDLPSSNLINGDYEMCLVFLSHLGMLFVKCLYDPFCNAPISSTEKFYSGSMITVKSTCCKNHTHVWRSQPIVKKRPLGNLVLSAGVLYSGNTYHTLREIFNTSHVRIFSERTFYEIQDRFLFPTINRMYKIHLKELRSGT